MKATFCQCEHVSHASPGTRALEATPNGHEGHKYDESFEAEILIEIDTTYGKYTVCLDCEQDCQHPSHGFRKLPDSLNDEEPIVDRPLGVERSREQGTESQCGF